MTGSTEKKLCKHGDGRPVFAKEECEAHYRRTRRGSKKTGPIEKKKTGYVFLGVRVEEQVVEALLRKAEQEHLEKDGKPNLYAAHQRVLEEWAAGL